MSDQLKKYFDLLSKWNRKINLTAIDDEAGFIEKHAGDVVPVMEHIQNVVRVIDLGTGAGIPGIILKIMKPGLDVTLVDSTRKKISFCSEAIRSLGLSGIRAEWGRAEEEAFCRKLGKFDLVISRATWKLAEFLDIAMHYVENGGRIIAMKGPMWQKELEEAKFVLEANHLILIGSYPYRLSGGEDRCLLLFSNNWGQA